MAQTIIPHCSYCHQEKNKKCIGKQLSALRQDWAGHIARFGVKGKEQHLLKAVTIWRNKNWWNTQKRINSEPFVEKLIAAGVLLYAAVGVWCLFKGGNFLDYNALDPEHPSHGQHLGILLVELGVGITVFSAMLMIFYKFALRGKEAQ